jgi:hypothetical protein
MNGPSKLSPNSSTRNRRYRKQIVNQIVEHSTVRPRLCVAFSLSSALSTSGTPLNVLDYISMSVSAVFLSTILTRSKQSRICPHFKIAIVHDEWAH